MSVNPVSVKALETQTPVSRPPGLTPIIMSGWVTPSKPSENEDIENPEKKRIKVCDVYAQKCVPFDDGTNGTISDVKLFDPEAERVLEAREMCAMAAAILKRY